MSQPADPRAPRPLPKMATPMLLLLLAYPVLVHLAVAWHKPQLQWLALVVLCAIPQYRSLRAAHFGNWLLLIVLAGLLYGLTFMGGGIYALFLPPVMVPAMLCAVFAGSLRARQVPVVTRVAQAEHGALNPDVRAYTRQVTELWVLVLGALVLLDAGLAAFAPLPVWSLFSNCLNYVLVGLIFVIEYLYRRWRFRDLNHPGFINYIRLIAGVDYKSI